MNKKQTYISYLYDQKGKRIDFERWSCKRISTVKKNMLKLWDNSLYRAFTRNAVTVKVYATPDGYNATNCVDSFELPKRRG